MTSSVVVVGVLDKVDRVRAGVGVLVHLEVVGGKSKRSQDQVPQVLQFTCSRGHRSEIKGHRQEVFQIITSIIKTLLILD